jgi:DNA polymerase III epsilon subunit-like protein
MNSIFFDLETTDLERVGQILNFAIVVVDNNFQVIDTLKSKVKISRLQLPRISAILANRTDVTLHQQESSLTEYEAALQIQQFLKKHSLGLGYSTPLIGYNSSRFDVDFLRTVLIRNGVNPYQGKVVTKDLLLLSRHLMATHSDFRERVFHYFGEDKVNLRLESLCKILNLTNEAQSHESFDDVMLTIGLAKYYLDVFQADIRTFEPYQIKHLHSHPRGSVFQIAEPLSSKFEKDKPYHTYPAVLLDNNDRYSIWINLRKFKENAEMEKNIETCLRWKKFAEHTVFPVDGNCEESWREVSSAALNKFQTVTIANYFGESNCDIEQFIYRIKPGEIAVLNSAIESRLLPERCSSDIKQLAKRHWLENYQGTPSEDFLDSLKLYAEYRYGGKLLLRNCKSLKVGEEDKIPSHPTLEQLISEIDKVLASDSSQEDKQLAQSLHKFYRDSELLKLISPH